MVLSPNFTSNNKQINDFYSTEIFKKPIMISGRIELIID